MFVLVAILLLNVSLSTVGNNSLIQSIHNNKIINKETSNYLYGSTSVLVRIYEPEESRSLIQKYDFVGWKPDEWIDVIVPGYQMPDIADNYQDYTVLLDDVEEYNNMVKGDYHTYPEMESFLQNIANNYPYIRQIIPFVKTPINLMMAIVDRTPLGFARKQFRDDFFGRSGNLYRTAQVRGQIATGFALITYANYLASTGQITGSTSLPSDAPIKSKGLKDLNRSLGFQPYSLRTFNEETGKYEYYAFGRLDPFGAFLGLVADFHTFHNKLTQDELARVGNSMLLTLYRQGEDVSGQLGTGTQLANYAKAGWSVWEGGTDKAS